MAHSIPEGAPRPLIDVIDSKSLLQLSQQHLRCGAARLQPWRTISHKGFVRTEVCRSKPCEHQLASHIELLVGCDVEPRGNHTNTPLLNGDVLLLPSDNTAVHNQIVHASSRRSSPAWCMIKRPLRVSSPFAQKRGTAWALPREY